MSPAASGGGGSPQPRRSPAPVSQAPRPGGQVGGAGDGDGEATPAGASAPRPALRCLPASPVTSSVTRLRPSGQGRFSVLQTAAASPLPSCNRGFHHHPSGETSGLSSLKGVLSGGDTYEAPCPSVCVAHHPGGHRGCVRWLGQWWAACIPCRVGFEGADVQLARAWGTRAAHPLPHTPPPPGCAAVPAACT